MKGNGNGWKTLLEKLYFYALPTSGMRSKYLKKHKDIFRSFGDKVFFQPRQLPSDPELISIGNNVKIASDVLFINHDVTPAMFNAAGYSNKRFESYCGCIEIGDNVMIGAKSIIMPNVRIGSNVVIAAGSIVTKDVPDGQIWGGVPARYIGDLETLVDKRSAYRRPSDTDAAWQEFYDKRRHS